MTFAQPTVLRRESTMKSDQLRAAIEAHLAAEGDSGTLLVELHHMVDSSTHKYVASWRAQTSKVLRDGFEQDAIKVRTVPPGIYRFRIRTPQGKELGYEHIEVTE